MRKLTGTLVLALGSLFALSGCTTTGGDKSGYVVEDKSPEALYADSRRAMELGNFTKATQLLEALDSRYPFGAHKLQVQLDLIYAYYKLEDNAQALANIDRFLRLNPTHDDIDYVHYMRGLVNMQADGYLFHDAFGVDRTDRDPSHAIEAFRDFDTLVRGYPNSRYAPDAHKRMIMLKNRLASFDLKVAEYYVTMEAWVAAANRAQQVMETYPGTPSVERALEIMVDSYDRLGQVTMRDNSLAVLKASYPDNRFSKRF